MTTASDIIWRVPDACETMGSEDAVDNVEARVVGEQGRRNEFNGRNGVRIGHVWNQAGDQEMQSEAEDSEDDASTVVDFQEQWGAPRPADPNWV